MQYTVGLQHRVDGERKTAVVTLTPEQVEIANAPRAPRSCIINGFVAHAANHVELGYEWDGDLSTIRPVQ
jgi:hypothetical protein